MSYTKVSPRIRDIIEAGKLYALRDKNGRLYNVSYSPEGLEWTTRLDEKPIMFKDAKFYTTVTGTNKQWTTDTTYQGPKVIVYGNTERNPFYEIEYPFIPRDHFRANGTFNGAYQKDEYLYIKKALMLLS